MPLAVKLPDDTGEGWGGVALVTKQTQEGRESLGVGGDERGCGHLAEARSAYETEATHTLS